MLVRTLNRNRTKLISIPVIITIRTKLEIFGEAIVGHFDQSPTFDVSRKEPQSMTRFFEVSKEFRNSWENTTTKALITEIRLHQGEVNFVKGFFDRGIIFATKVPEDTTDNPAVGAASEIQRRPRTAEDFDDGLLQSRNTCTAGVH